MLPVQTVASAVTAPGIVDVTLKVVVALHDGLAAVAT